MAAALTSQVGFFLLLLARCMGLVAVTAAQTAFHASLERVGLVTASVGGVLFAGLLAFRQREAWLAAGFALLVAAALAAGSGTAVRTSLPALPSAPALLYMASALYVFLARRRLFPELTANVLDAAVFDSRDAVVVFDRNGAYIDSGTAGLAGAVSFEGMTDMGEFLRRVQRSLVSGQFFTLEELACRDHRRMTREISLAGPDGARHYLVLANPVRPRPRSRLGCVCGFYDITPQKSLEAELIARTAELTDLNARLAGSLTAAERLESERARQAAAEEVHRTLGLRIEGLVASIGGGAAVEDVVEGCRAVMADVRSTVAALFSQGARRGTRA